MGFVLWVTLLSDHEYNVNVSSFSHPGTNLNFNLKVEWVTSDQMEMQSRFYGVTQIKSSSRFPVSFFHLCEHWKEGNRRTTREDKNWIWFCRSWYRIVEKIRKEPYQFLVTIFLFVMLACSFWRVLRAYSLAYFFLLLWPRMVLKEPIADALFQGAILQYANGLSIQYVANGLSLRRISQPWLFPIAIPEISLKWYQWY